MSKILKETNITDCVRVVILAGEYFPFIIQTEQKVSATAFPWEVNSDGWRACVIENSRTLDEAIKKHEAQVASERRWH